MRPLPPPPFDDVQVLDEIIAAKAAQRAARLRGIRSRVVAAYANYAAVAPEIAGLNQVAWNDEQREALIHAYQSPTAPLRRLREKLLGDVLAARCPFCAVSESSTLDHYIPKELHPHFAVLSKNLVPSCPTCNTRKQKQIVDRANGVRLFVHPYFDALPNLKFLEIRIEVRPRSVLIDFEIARPAGLNAQIHKRLVSHFDLLGLADRYRLMSLDEIRSRHHTLQRVYAPDNSSVRVRQVLFDEAATHEAAYGLNHWRTVLYNGLAESHMFCSGGFNQVIA